MFEGFEPKLSRALALASDVLFLANIQPDLQREVRAQLPDARFVALDSMNLWIDIARDSLVAAIAERRLRDPQRRRAAPADGQAQPRHAPPARSSPGPPTAPRPRPERRRRQAGRVRRRAVTREGFFALPAYPLETVVDPTGAGDTFAGGFVGYIAAHPDEPLADELLRRAMAHATRARLVQRRGVRHRARRAPEGQEIAARVEELHAMTQFSGAPLALRG